MKLTDNKIVISNLIRKLISYGLNRDEIILICLYWFKDRCAKCRKKKELNQILTNLNK